MILYNVYDIYIYRFETMYAIYINIVCMYFVYVNI